ncbi:hypothetical protein [Paraburkholderia panacisoli]|nr:hypothetical protein [Paraburkholderia panacisoli]
MQLTVYGKDYLERFKRYWEKLKDETIPVDDKNPVFEEISRDISFP